MFKRRDIPPVLLLLLLIVLVMLTLSQILVVHNGRYGGRSVHNIRKLQLELREMDINLHSLMLQNVPSIELNRRLLQNQINAERIATIIRQAAEPQLTTKTASTVEGHGLHQEYQQKNHQSHRLLGKNNLTRLPGLVTRDTMLLASRKAALLYRTPNATKSAQHVAQKSVLSPNRQHIENTNNSPNQVVGTSNQSVEPSGNQLDQRKSSSTHYSRKCNSTSSNNRKSSSTDSVHKQNHTYNVANTFHESLDINHQTGPSVNNMNTKRFDCNSLTHEHFLKEFPLTQKNQQMSQTKDVPADITQKARSYCPSIPPGLRKFQIGVIHCYALSTAFLLYIHISKST